MSCKWLDIHHHFELKKHNLCDSCITSEKKHYNREFSALLQICLLREFDKLCQKLELITYVAFITD